jgi:hypothetical protein
MTQVINNNHAAEQNYYGLLEAKNEKTNQRPDYVVLITTIVHS